MESISHFPITDSDTFKIKMLNWVSRFSIFCFLDNCNYENGAFECMLAAGSKRSVTLGSVDAFETLKDFYEKEPSWLFGHLGYDINNCRASATSANSFPHGHFFSPEILLQLSRNELLIIHSNIDPAAIFNDINKQEGRITISHNSVHISNELSKEEYISIINRIHEHIRRGDCYEINFCQRFYSDNGSIDPLYVFKRLREISPNPFTAFYKLNDNYCLCASPERFLKKVGQQLISQPIKGTSRRDKDQEKDKKSRSYLENSAKEKSENVMIVDLVRNDLSRVCTRGSVHVGELFGIYPFPQVYQMISTIKGELDNRIHWTKALQEVFPMGSMTGAPKKRVMELIAAYERSPRGLFSGAIGYITPNADFDFNVVIRSIFYNETARHISFWAGSGITFKSDAALEYEECLLKAEAMINVLQ